MNGQYKVETYGEVLLPPLTVIEKNIKGVDKVAESLRALIRQIGVRRKFAAIAVAGSAVLSRIIQMNAEFTERELEEQIELEADRYIPYPLDEVYFDFEIIGLNTKNPNLIDVLLAAARFETVDIRISAVTEAGLKPTVVDLESLVMERAFGLVVNHLPAKGAGVTIALIDIGATNTTLYVFKDLKVIYNRDQAFGGKHLTDEIQKRYGLSLEEAIAAEKFGGLPEDYVTEVLEPFKETIVQQVSRALQTFSSSAEEAEVNHIVLAGGVSLLPGLESLIQEKLSFKTFIANPFSEMEISTKVDKNSLMADAPGLMMACGLALRTFDNE